MNRAARKTAITALTLTVTIASSALPARGHVPLPLIEGPITGPGNYFVSATSFNLADVGYTAEEYFISGDARSFTTSGPLTSDGHWDVTEAIPQASFKTRILVFRPIKKQDFRGTVVVEWLNVSAGLDTAPDWTAAHTHLVNAGMVWVGVSAQYVGVEGGGGSFLDLSLKNVNPARYGSLNHPGDSFSYDIFSQAGAALTRDPIAKVLGDLKPRRLIAAGESQSAFRLVTYINGVHTDARIFDGFFVHSRASVVAPLSQAPQAAIAAPPGTLVRTDLDTPVLTLQAETDVTILGSHLARQADTDRLRFWEVAGTGHADLYTLRVGATDKGDDPSVLAVVENASPIPGIITCDEPVNAGPQHHITVKAALRGLDQWIRGRRTPPHSPLIELDGGSPPAIVRDAVGNAVGGIRSPWVDVPTAALSGEGQGGGGFCSLFGTTQLLDGPTLTALYGSQRLYNTAVRRSAREMQREGFLLRRDARLVRQYRKSTPLIP
jgi:hypothetical protein